MSGKLEEWLDREESPADYVFDPAKHKAEFVPPRTVEEWEQMINNVLIQIEEAITW